MRFVFGICAVMVFAYSCKAQIAPLYKLDLDLPEGTRYKDLDGDLDKFEGTWRWQRNDSIVTMVLQKKEDVFQEDTSQYEDYIIGEYKFTVGGQVIQDYLPN